MLNQWSFENCCLSPSLRDADLIGLGWGLNIRLLTLKELLF